MFLFVIIEIVLLWLKFLVELMLNVKSLENLEDKSKDEGS